jgi:hypothetical protein
MIGELFFALIRIAIYFFIFYFFYRVLGSFFRGLKGDNRNRPSVPHQQPPSQKPVQKYTDVEDAKFKDIPPEIKE